MPVIYMIGGFWGRAGRIYSVQLILDQHHQTSYHDSKGIPPEETTVYVRGDAYGECTVRPLNSQLMRNWRSEEHRPNRCTDLALIWELSADKVVGDPTNTSNCHKDGLFSGS